MNLDIRLIHIFLEMFDTRSVSRTAENLELGQSAVSMSLGKLRETYGDALFVRTHTGMEPTPHAQALFPMLREAERLIRASLTVHAAFDPLTAQRKFKLCTSDAGRVILVPDLLARLNLAAPNVRLEASLRLGDIAEALASGASDVAVGYMPELDSGIMRQKLYDEHYVCCVAAGHPRVRDHLTMADFERERHIIVTPSRAGKGVIASYLETHGITRPTGIVLPNYSSVTPILKKTDFLVVLPSKLATSVSDYIPLRLFSLPFTSPTYPISQHWHERYTRDPGLMWLRAIMADLFQPSRMIEHALRQPDYCIS